MSGSLGDRLLEAGVSLMSRRMSRRRLLERSAIAGSALAVAPLRYLLRPLSAIDVVTCSDCSSGDACCDGWTAFCCTLTGSNACPSYSYMAGWWKCTNYTGTQMCSAENVRYYVDCNRTPTATCSEGCHCANDDCHHRGTCCNLFRYGQCNTEVSGTTEVVCRVVTCVNPCDIYVNCNCTYFEDNNTCSHEAACL